MWRRVTFRRSRASAAGRRPFTNSRSGGGFGVDRGDRGRGRRRIGLSTVAGHFERCDLDAVAPTFLGVIERAIGLRQKLSHIERRSQTVNQPDADRTAYWVAIDLLCRLGKRFSNPLGHGQSFFAAGVVEHRGKFLAAKPCNEVRPADRLACRRAEYFQHTIADRMTEAIVDRFEMIEIDDEERGWARVG